MDDIDRLPPTYEPLTPRVAQPDVAPPDRPAPTPHPATSSRPGRVGGRGLAGILGVSMATATLASVVTVGVILGTGAGTTPATAAGSPATAATNAPLTITADDAIVAVAESASPAVVTITTESAGRSGFGPFSMPGTGVGSGFVFDADGLILTNHHVIEGAGGAESITVTFQDGTELPATVVADDPERDLAVLQVEATRPADDRGRRLVGAQGRAARRRHRQPARDVHRVGHERHPVGHRPDDRGRLAS